MSVDTPVLPTDALLRGRRDLGDFELLHCTDGTYRLDGGAMFGVVPKTLWQKRIAADENNTILLGLNTTVVRTGKHIVVIETGLGNKQSAKMQAIHQNQALLPQSFKAAGISKTDVTHVINTHLHFDHCGWNTILHEDGSVTPTFPNARYFATAGEIAHGRLQLERDAVSYLAPNYDPLIASGQLTLLDIDGSDGYTKDDARLQTPAGVRSCDLQTTAEIVPGITVQRWPGHTDSMLGVHIESRGEQACYIGDLVPTHHHLDATWVMGYDLDPLRCIAERKRFLQWSVRERVLVLFTHDHDLPAARIGWNDKGKPMVA